MWHKVSFCCTLHLTNYPRKTNKTCEEVKTISLATLSCGLLHLDTPVLTDQQRLTCMCGHWIPFRGPAKIDGRLKWMARKSQGNPWYQLDLMMKMMIFIYTSDVRIPYITAWTHTAQYSWTHLWSLYSLMTCTELSQSELHNFKWHKIYPLYLCDLPVDRDQRIGHPGSKL